MAQQDNEVQRSLGRLLGRSSLDPVDQTIFETGPRATFQAPEVADIYQEGKTYFADQPISVDRSAMDWYSLGQNAFKIAQDTFGSVLDYLVDSKRNALAEVKNKYEADINLKYEALQFTQAMAKESGKPEAYQDGVNSLISEIRELRTNWRKEASEAIDNNKESLFEPKIDYWDDNLDVKGYGTKYQELAVAARAADRDIDRTIRRTEWDAISSGLLRSDEAENFAAIKAGQIPFKKDGKYDPVTSGKAVIPAGENGLPIKTATGLPLGYDMVDGRLTMRTDSTGVPVYLIDDNGNHRLNPSAGITWFNSPEEVEAYIDIVQRYPSNDPAVSNQSMLHTYQGLLAPDTASRIQYELQKPEGTQSPAALYFAASVVSKLPPNAIGSTVQTIGLTKEQGEKLTLMAELARSGGGFEGVSRVRGMQAKDITQTVRYIESLRGDRMLLSGGVKPEESFGYEQDTEVINTFLLPIIAAAYGITDEETENFQSKYEVGIATQGRNDIGIRDIDPTDTYSLGVLLDQNPEYKAAAMHAMAFLLSNKQAMVDSSGNFDTDKLKEAAKRFTESHMALAGMVRVIGPDNRESVVRNEGYLWFSSFLEGTTEDRPKQQERALAAVLAQPEALTVMRQTSGSQESVITSLARTPAIPGSDTEVVRAMVDELRVIAPDSNSGINTSQVLPPEILLPIQVASHPNAWRLYGDGKPLPPNATFEQKLERAKLVLQDIAPITEWGFGIDNREDLIAFSRSPNGGLPIGFKKIPVKTLKDSKGNPMDLLKELIPPSQIMGYNEETNFYVPTQNGMPVISVPSYMPGTDKYSAISNRVASERLSVLNGKTTTRLAFKEVAPSREPITTEEIIATATFAGNKEIMHQLKFAASSPIGTVEQAMNDIRLNADVILRAAEDMAETDVSIKESLPVLRKELALAGGIKRLFSDSNMTLILKEAQAQGAQSMADVYSFMIGVAKARHLNIEPQKKQKRAYIKSAMDETGVPIHSTDFVIPAGNRIGMIIADPDTQDYWDRLRTAANSGYNIYRDPTEQELYIAKSTDKVPTTIAGDVPMDLLLSGKTNETEEEFNKKFEQAFGLQISRTQNRKTVREALKSFVDREYVDYTAKRADATTLPSRQKAAFDSAYSQFRKDMNLDSSSVNPRDAALAYNYDWAAYWRDNNSFPFSLENLPQQYVLEDKTVPIPTAKTVEKIRETYEIPLNQPDLNKALSIFTQDYFPAESDTFDNVDMERVKRFKQAKWHPAAFEYQVRVVAEKNNTLNLREVLKNKMKPDTFVMDSVVMRSLQEDWMAIRKELTKTSTPMPKGSAYPDPLYPEVYYTYSKQFDKMLKDDKYAIDFKQAYLLEILSPSGRTNTTTTKERRRQLLIDVLNRSYSD